MQKYDKQSKQVINGKLRIPIDAKYANRLEQGLIGRVVGLLIPRVELELKYVLDDHDCLNVSDDGDPERLFRPRHSKHRPQEH